jgi:cystathionine gamma-lyase
MTLLKSGDHVVCTDDCYGGTYRIFTKIFQEYGIDFTFVDTRDPDALAAALGPRTRLAWIETPSNPLLKIVDLRAVAALCAARGVISVVDNTFATPCLQRPLELGIDLVAHSTTKYLGGHSDVVGGALVTAREDLHARLRFAQNAVGAVPGPFDAWLVLRGLKTLPVRMERHCENGLAVARFLESHPRVERVIYPFLPSHPQAALARSQMSAGGGMVSVELQGGLAAADRFLRRLKVFTLAESLGGVESLAESPAIMTHASVPAAIRAANGLADGLVRLSVGLEHIDDLRTDLDQALTP